MSGPFLHLCLSSAGLGLPRLTFIRQREGQFRSFSQKLKIFCRSMSINGIFCHRKQAGQWKTTDLKALKIKLCTDLSTISTGAGKKMQWITLPDSNICFGKNRENGRGMEINVEKTRKYASCKDYDKRHRLQKRF